MTALTRNPNNPNFLQSNKFTLSFGRLPNTQFFCQAVAIPGIMLSEIPQNTPFVDVYVPGEKAVYDVLNVTFLVDEDLTGFLEIHDWIRAMTFPKEFSEYKNLKHLNRFSGLQSHAKPQYSDANITLLSSTNIPRFKFSFYDVFPTTLSSIIMSASDTPENTLTCDATFRYTLYDIEKI